MAVFQHPENQPKDQPKDQPKKKIPPIEKSVRSSPAPDRLHYYQALMECIHEDILMVDCQLRIMDVNDHFLDRSGYKLEEVIGRHCYEICHGLSAPCSGEHHVCPHAEVVKSGLPAQVIHRHISRFGEERWADILCSPLKDSWGAVIGVIEAVRDITELVKVQEDFSKSEIFLSSVLEQSPFSTWIADENGTNIRINQACRDLFGIRDGAEVVGKYNLFRDNVLRDSGYLPSVERVFRSGVPATFTIDYDFSKVSHVQVAAATHRLPQVTLFPIKDQDGALTHVVVQHRS